MEHFYQKIEGWHNAERLYSDMVAGAAPGAHFVEVGAWKGRSAAHMCVEIINANKVIHFDVVDHFKGGPEHVEYDCVVNDTLFDEFIKNMAPVDGFYRLRPLRSTFAAELYRDAILDFCYIDGSHAYADVKSDILAWLPKMKPGALLAGDDYDAYPDVRRAVNELLPGAIADGNIWKYTCPSP